jgi:hypothetical protein
MCAVIQTAVEDYRIARRRGLVVNDKLILQGRIGKIRTMDQISELRSLIDFFFKGGLQAIIDAASLQDEQGQYLDAASITKAL